MMNFNPMMMMQMMQNMQQLKSNPMAILQQRGLNVPQGLNDPQAIINHLVQSGQVPQSRIQAMMQMMGGGRNF